MALGTVNYIGYSASHNQATLHAVEALLSLKSQESSPQNPTQSLESSSLSSSPDSSSSSPAIPDVVTPQPTSLVGISGMPHMSASNASARSSIVPLSGVAVDVSDCDDSSAEGSDDVSITHLVSRLDEALPETLKLFGEGTTKDDAWNLKFQEILEENSVYPWSKVMFEDVEYLGKAYSFEDQGKKRRIVVFCDYEFTEIKNVQSVERFSNEKISIGMLGNITYVDGVCTREIGGSTYAHEGVSKYELEAPKKDELSVKRKRDSETSVPNKMPKGYGMEARVELTPAHFQACAGVGIELRLNEENHLEIKVDDGQFKPLKKLRSHTSKNGKLLNFTSFVNRYSTNFRLIKSDVYDLTKGLELFFPENSSFPTFYLMPLNADSGYGITT